ncbi:MAG: carboxypeptidase-like regulatory domain-containing protein, partial [Bacteroidales bacterium]|nr:carboxypeptidase-like regulatory domain-containing protein [Bacteroidales bacterium]
MKNTVLLTIILGIVFQTGIYAQEAGDTLWTKTYGGADDDKGWCVQQTSDEGYVITGWTKSYGAGSYDIYLVKTNAAGDTIWTKSYDGEDGSDDARCIRQTPDGGYIIAGNTQPIGIMGSYIWLIKTNSSGDTLWTKKWGETPIPAINTGRCVQLTSDGGYIISGYAQFLGSNNEEAYLLKTDADGNTDWINFYGGTAYEIGYWTQQTSDGGYIVVGYTTSFGNGNEDVYLIKTDEVGDTVWTKFYGGTGMDLGYSVQQTSDNGYIIAGLTDSFGEGNYDAYIIKTNEVGDTVWTKTYGGANIDKAYSIQAISDGTYIVSGTTRSFEEPNGDIYILKLDSYGDTLWTKTYGTEYDDRGWSVQQTSDGNYIISGYTGKYDDVNVYMLKIVGEPVNEKPVANAGQDQIVNENTEVTLDGSGSYDPDDDDITYLWTAPAEITLSDITAANPVFTAPEVDEDTDFIFTLVVNDGELDSDPDEIIITITNYVASGLIWEAEAEWAICKSVGISDETYHSFIGWHTNDEAWAYFGETNNTPLWIYDINGAEELPHDITSDGTYMVGGTGNTVYGFTPSSGTPDWTYIISNSGDDIFNIVISDDGETIYYVSGDDYDYSYITSVDISTSTENWNFSLPDGGYAVKLVISANGERLLIEQYYNTIVYSNNGDLLFDLTRVTGAGPIPAISDDGNIFAIGDYDGYSTMYEYNAITETYDAKWKHLFDGGASYNWVSAIAVSGNGSTIALGSLQSEGGGVYNGELSIFNTESNEPLWTYQSVNDEVVAIDISYDGSVIAAASYGPLDDNGDDFWLFNRDSSEPVFVFTCQGSPYDIDLSNDASKCIVGGKAVHARVSGHGGKLYYFNFSPTLPSVSGTVIDIDTNEPIEGAIITLGTSYNNTTNSSGFYNIEDVLTGTYTLTCELTGYETYTETINISGDTIIDIELQNLYLPVLVSGTVTDIDTD